MGRRDEDDEVELELWEIASTEKAVLYRDTEGGEGKQAWVPRSVCRYVRRDPPVEGKPRKCHVVMEAWKANQLFA